LATFGAFLAAGFLADFVRVFFAAIVFASLKSESAGSLFRGYVARRILPPSVCVNEKNAVPPLLVVRKSVIDRTLLCVQSTRLVVFGPFHGGPSFGKKFCKHGHLTPPVASR
jgi:hypothetical protein